MCDIWMKITAGGFVWMGAVSLLFSYIVPLYYF